MSYGEPNNPYGAPQQQPSGPGYGYPQQQPPAQQQGYGYPQQGYPQHPQQQGYPGYPGGAQVPQSMPGLLVTARVFLFIIGGFQIIVGGIMLLAAVGSGALTSSQLESAGLSGISPDAVTGIFAALGLLFLALSPLSITLGVKFAKGGNGVRITTIVYGAVGAAMGLLALVGGGFAGVLWLVFSGIMIAACAQPSGKAWFNRPRY
ncbi:MULTISPECIES: hypothetical protein [Streptomyces]|uniref:hypothetical protein n=1 Tax=Streptomyces TaxID=1883 RepID=UPI000A83396E|nr:MULTISPECIES: hypothetical protein [Streptomyces]MDH6225433.1 hypothetical protein [Streptomyces sp. MJP52]